MEKSSAVETAIALINGSGIGFAYEGRKTWTERPVAVSIRGYKHKKVIVETKNNYCYTINDPDCINAAKEISKLLGYKSEVEVEGIDFHGKESIYKAAMVNIKNDRD